MRVGLHAILIAGVIASCGIEETKSDADRVDARDKFDPAICLHDLAQEECEAAGCMFSPGLVISPTCKLGTFGVCFHGAYAAGDAVSYFYRTAGPSEWEVLVLPHEHEWVHGWEECGGLDPRCECGWQYQRGELQ